jgi:hypothetical protein
MRVYVRRSLVGTVLRFLAVAALGLFVAGMAGWILIYLLAALRVAPVAAAILFVAWFVLRGGRRQ